MADVNLGTLKFLFDVDTKKAGEKVDSIGQKMEKFGTQMTALVSIPLAAFGTTAVSTFSEFEQALAKVEATSGASSQQMETLEAKARALGASTKFSATQVADGFNFMAMAGWDANEMLAGIDHTLNLSIASGADLAQTTDIVTDSLTAFKLGAEDTEHFVDVLAQTSRNANTNVELMGETFKYAAPTAGALGISVEDLSLAIGLMANAGIKGSQAGTSLRGGLVNLLKPTDAMNAAMQKYGIELVKNADGSTNLRATMVNLRTALNGVEQQEQATALATIFGKQALAGWQAIVNASEKDFNKLASAIDNSRGSTKEMAEIMGDTFKGKVTALKSAFEEFMIIIGEKLVPFFTSLINSLSSALTWFGNLDEGTQKLIVSFGVFSAALPPIMALVGKLSTSFSGLSGKIKGLKISDLTSKLKSLNPVVLGVMGAVAALVVAVKANATYNDLLGTTILDTKDDMGLFERAVAKLTGIEKHSKDELIEMGLAYRDFSDNVSPDFAAAVDNNQQAVYKFNTELERMNFDGVLSEDEVTTFKTNLDTLATSVINLIREGGETSRKELSDWFKTDDGVMDENEQLVLSALERIETESINEVTTLKDEIFAIQQGAVNAKRELNEQEIQDIANKHQRIREIELEALAKNNEELLIAQNTFGARIRNMDLENAVALASQQAQQRDDNISKLEGYYNSKIELLNRKLPEMTAAEQAAAQEEINQLTQKRDDGIKLENDMWQGILEQIAQNNPLVLENLNRFNGTILNEEDKKNQSLLNAQKRAYTDMQQITKDGTYQVKSLTTGAWQEITVDVDEATGEIVGIYDHFTGKQFGYTSSAAKNVGELGKKHGSLAREIEGALSRGEASYNKATGTITTNSGTIVGKLEDVKTAADGTVTGFVKINGTPVAIKSNADGTITAMKNVKAAVESIPRERAITIKKTTVEKTMRMNPVNVTGSSRPTGFSIGLLDTDNPMARDQDNSDIFAGFESYREKVQAAQMIQDNTKILEKLDNLIIAVNARRITTVQLDKRVLVEQITDPIMKEAAWRRKRL